MSNRYPDSKKSQITRFRAISNIFEHVIKKWTKIQIIISFKELSISISFYIPLLLMCISS